jgi:hypothetical protein
MFRSMKFDDALRFLEIVDFGVIGQIRTPSKAIPTSCHRVHQQFVSTFRFVIFPFDFS